MWNDLYQKMMKLGKLHYEKTKIVGTLYELGFNYVGRDSEGAKYIQASTGLKIYLYR